MHKEASSTSLQTNGAVYPNRRAIQDGIQNDGFDELRKLPRLGHAIGMGDLLGGLGMDYVWSFPLRPRSVSRLAFPRNFLGLKPFQRRLDLEGQELRIQARL